MIERTSLPRCAAVGVALVLGLGITACSSSSPTSTTASSDTATATTDASASDSSASATDDTADTASDTDTGSSSDTAGSAVDSSNTGSVTTTAAPTAANLCSLLPPDQAKTVLADLPGTGALVQDRDYEKACVYKKGDNVSVEIDKLDVTKDYQGAADYKSSHTGKLIFETVTDVPGVDQAYWNKSDSTLGFLKGTTIINVQVKLDDQSSDFDPTSDKSAEKKIATAVAVEAAPKVS